MKNIHNISVTLQVLKSTTRTCKLSLIVIKVCPIQIAAHSAVCCSS